MKKLVTLSLLTATCIASARSESAWHKSFAQEMQHMEKAFDSMVERMNAFGKELEHAFSQEDSSNLDVTIKEKESNVTITVKNLKTEQVEASLNDDTDQLKIRADQDTIMLAAQEKFLSLAHTKETKKEDKKDDKAAIYTSFGAYEMGQLLSSRINLSNADIQYDKKNQKLTITAPYVDKKKEIKKIPVTISNS